MASSTETPAIETHTAPEPQKVFPESQEELIIRPARLWEGGEIGRIAVATYKDTPLSQFVAPHRFQYWADWERGFIQRAQKRMLDPRNVSFVVCTKSNPDLAVGYAQFVRLGDDEGAKKQIESHSRLQRVRLWFFRLGYGAWCWLTSVMIGDRSQDPKAIALFDGWTTEEGKVHWDAWPERQNRWHVQSCVIRQEFQGRKAGKALMAEVIKRAEAESVVVGLEASKKGEPMYRSVGFGLLARFTGGAEFEGRAGGVMMYTPKARKSEYVNVE
ncbi:uncharacterized protein PAC_05036 [Phialocephala subalpina]|uniref:N-acetyltransferase domain-containing protein n=1 Tax=Phialocephala subalpina TaxID=576137 RepID=A0A1L7WQV4_9HELO|nr:uncharacterized protein PAC_05036 [Phialocephala subalpina]